MSAIDDVDSAWAGRGLDRSRGDRLAPSPIGPAGAPDAPSSFGAAEGNADLSGGLAISRTASGGGSGFTGEDSAAVSLSGGEERVGAFVALAERAGITRAVAGVTGGCLSGGDGDTALTTVTRRARSVEVGPVAVPRMRTSPPRKIT